jgi:hypothetical protein
MDYTLVLGLSYKKYKRPAEFTIHVGNNFIDTFTLEKEYGTKNKEILRDIDTTWYKHFQKEWMLKDTWDDIPTFYKVYTIPEQNLNGNLSIGIKNDNSDASNGFIKHSSLIKFHIIALFPSYLVENRGEKLMKIFTKIANWEYPEHSGQGIYAENKSIRNSWPLVSEIFVEPISELYEAKGHRHTSVFIGGSFNTNIPIKKKYGVKYLDSGSKKAKSLGYGFTGYPSCLSLVLASLTPLLNTYDENQRSNSTKD